MLPKHLKINKKSIINYIEEEEDDDQILEKICSKKNKNNLKILQVSKICDRLNKSINLKFSRTNQMIKAGFQIRDRIGQ